MNTTNTVNLRGLSDAALEMTLVTRLEELLGSVAWLKGWQVRRVGDKAGAEFDLLTTLPMPGGGQAALCVECRKELRPSVFRSRADRTFSPGGRSKVVVPVLAMPWVSPRVAELCAEHGWSWFDLAGNHRLEVPGVLRLEHTGNEPVHTRPRPTANLSTPEAGRVIRALLLPDHAGKRWTQREMQTHCQPAVSLGLVNKVVRRLRDEAFLTVGKDGGFRVSDPLKLLFAWRDVYRFDRHDRRGYFTLLQGKQLRGTLAELGLRSGGHAVYAAFSAADFQAPNVRQPKTWLYLRDTDIPMFEKLVEAKPVDSGENLMILIPSDEGVFYLADGGTMGVDRLACTNEIQTYVDLSHCGGRGAEAAEALLTQRLKPAWRSMGLEA
ncbi:MAG: hypothetical protein ABR538_05030 [Candidatus Binatia bacterium]